MTLLCEIEELVTQRKVKKGLHPTRPLAIYNYEQTVQYNNSWTETLMQCRGLIIDLISGDVVARPMRKFFNYEERKHTSTGPFDVMQKLDGSLGIFFYHGNEWIFASRGSFVSEQAQKGMQMAIDADLPKKCCKDTTYIFEIIYPENRIVVDYGKKRELVLLAIVTGDFDKPLNEVILEGNRLGVSTPSISEALTPEELKKRDIENEEGYVLRYRDTGERVKIKFDSYVNLHGIRTNFSMKVVHDWFMADHESGLQKKLDHIPDEFYADVHKVWDRMTETRKSSIEEFQSLVMQYKETAYKDVPVGPYKGNICKYLRLQRANIDPAAVVEEVAKRKVQEVETSMNHFDAKRHKISNAAPVIYILVGPSACGKSTYARSFCKHTSDTFVIVSRDIIRQMFGKDDKEFYNFAKYNEELVTQVSNHMIHLSLRKRKNVIIDNTHLQEKYIKDIYKQFAKYTSRIEVVLFDDANLELCLQRNTLRSRHVSSEVIAKQFKDFQKICAKKPWEDLNTEYFVKSEKRLQIDGLKQEEVVIFDIDGTLALNLGTRNIYDESRVNEDAKNTPITKICESIYQGGKKIIVCTGRTEGCRELTQKWLSENVAVSIEELHMRKINDARPDHKVKEEMWKDIATRYKIAMMFDDRCQVVDHARDLGFTVAQVADGYF